MKSKVVQMPMRKLLVLVLLVTLTVSPSSVFAAVQQAERTASPVSLWIPDVGIVWLDQSWAEEGVTLNIQAQGKLYSFSATTRELRASDGFVLTRENVPGPDNHVVLALAAPDGRRAEARFILKKGETRPIIIAGSQFYQLVAASDDLMTLMRVMEAAALALPPTSSGESVGSGRFGYTTNVVSDKDPVNVDCIIAWGAYIAAGAAMIAACGTPEPLEPIACAGAIAGYTAAGLNVAQQCSSNK